MFVTHIFVELWFILTHIALRWDKHEVRDSLEHDLYNISVNKEGYGHMN